MIGAGDARGDLANNRSSLALIEVWESGVPLCCGRGIGAGARLCAQTRAARKVGHVCMQ